MRASPLKPARGQYGICRRSPELRKRQLFLPYNSFLCITFLFGKLDPIAPLTLFGMNTIGVFLGVIYAWVFIDIIWPSMVGLLALMLLDVLPATALLNKGFGDPTVIMMMFIFVFSATPRSLRPGEVYLALVRQPQVRHGGNRGGLPSRCCSPSPSWAA